MNIISKPDIAPSDPPPPPPKEHVARMTPPPVVQAPLVWRVKPTDLEDLIRWLPAALKERWPRIAEESVWNWFRAAAVDKNTMFIRTQNVAGMFTLNRDTLEPNLRIVERFVRGNGKGKFEEYTHLYLYVRDFGIQCRAVEMEFNVDTDAWQAIKNVCIAALRDRDRGMTCENGAFYRLIYGRR